MKTHGLLLIDKEEGPTSHDVVHEVRKILGQKDIGHAGTLDPMASGLMVLLLGEATKISDLLLNGEKGYEATVELGVTTDTLDREGQVLTRAETVSVPPEDVAAAVQSLQGMQELPVPQFSAIKIRGKKLYEYARSGQSVELPLRAMEFLESKLLSFEGRLVSVSLRCSKGSYVRSWAQALGEKLGTGACVTELKRVFSAPYDVQSAIRVADMRNLKTELGFMQMLQKLRETGALVELSHSVPFWPAVNAVGADVRLIENGVLSSSLKGRLAQTVRHSSGGRILSTDGSKLLALVETDEYSNIRLRRVFRYGIDAGTSKD